MDEVNVISVQLQELLNVPPIGVRKGSNDMSAIALNSDGIVRLMERDGNRAPSTLNSCYETIESISGLTAPFGQGRIDMESEGHFLHNGKQNGQIEAHVTVSPLQSNNRMRPLRPNPTSLLGGPPPPVILMSASRMAQQHHFNTRMSGHHPQPRHPNGHSPPKYSYMARNPAPIQAQRFESVANGNNQQRPRSKIISHMQELLRNKSCPRNIVLLQENLIAASLEEHKPMYHLNLDEEVVFVFEQHCIRPLTERSPKFVKAKYFCHICNYHMDNITNVLSHISNARHQANAKEHELDLDVQNIPFPSDNHITNLGFLLETVLKNNGIDESERALRIGVLEKINRLLEPHDFKLELFGSSVSGFGFKTSDINFNLNLTSVKHELTGESLTGADHVLKVAHLSKILQTFPFVRDVVEGQHSLELKFKDAEVGRNCSVQVNNIAGVLLAQLFEQYSKLDERVRFLVVAFRFWARQTGIDDQEQGYLPGHAFSVMVLKHLIDVAVLPLILVPDNITQSFRTFFMHDSPFFLHWTSENRETLGSLWVGLLRKYSVEFNFKENVISLVQKDLLKSEDKIWNRKISVEDPIIPRSNLCRGVSTNRVFDYIIHTIKVAFQYFGLPRSKGGAPIFNKATPFRLIRDPTKIYTHDESGPPEIVDKERMAEIHRHYSFQEFISDRWNAEQFFVHRIRLVKVPDYNGNKINKHIIAEDLPLLDRFFFPADYFFEFDRTIFQDGEEPPKHCRSCGKDDHVKTNCPEEILPIFPTIALPDETTLLVFTSVMNGVYEMKRLTTSCASDRSTLVQDIYDYLREHLSDVEVMLFGSTANGFGLRGSDVDISVRLNSHPVDKANLHDAATAELLQSMVQILRASGCMQDVFAIPTAKVPIVKFKHKQSGLEGDISFYNILPLRNTKLLRTYSNIDRRVKILGCFLKQLTKICDIGDASKGSLSSYAYVLMLIHFLQQLPIPVLPVLQEIPPGHKPVTAYDGWDTYFFSDLERLAEHWEYLGRNHDSVAALLLQFFRYYTEEFNYEANVITISQLAPLPRKEACFAASTLICIEDPFEKSHNLGAGLTRRMSVFIIKTLQRFRRVFSRSIPTFPPAANYIPFFLDPAVIRGEFNPPVDRQCRICNKIGHYANSCAFRNTSDDHDDQENEGDGDLPDQELSITHDLALDQY